MSISVVIPCYNAAPYLGEALESVLNQNIDALEIVVVDDGSTDESAEVARRYAQVRVITQANLGISAARNRGIAVSTGNIIALLDADDVMAANSLSSRLAILEANPNVGVALGLVAQFISPDVDDVTRNHIAISDEPSRGRVVGAMLMRRTVFDTIGVFDSAFQLGETIDWVARADAANIQMQSVNTVVLRRRIHAANSVRKAEQLRADYLRVLRASIERQRAGQST
ncbi:MAG: glycosyltransferase [Gemmatimonas sp.]